MYQDIYAGAPPGSQSPESAGRDRTDYHARAPNTLARPDEMMQGAVADMVADAALLPPPPDALPLARAGGGPDHRLLAPRRPADARQSAATAASAAAICCTRRS